MLIHNSGNVFDEPHGAETAPSILQATSLKFHTLLTITIKDTVKEIKKKKKKKAAALFSYFIDSCSNLHSSEGMKEMVVSYRKNLLG